MIVWIIGLSGSGKTTVSQALVARLRAAGEPTVFLDGDELRRIWEDDLGHTMADRRKNHTRFSELCKLLDQPTGPHVVVAALSIFPDLQAWNRQNLSRYLEVFLDPSMDVITARDPKKIYARAARGELKDVVGVDIPFPRPANPDLVFSGADTALPPEDIARVIASRMESMSRDENA